MEVLNVCLLPCKHLKTVQYLLVGFPVYKTVDITPQC